MERGSSLSGDFRPWLLVGRLAWTVGLALLLLAAAGASTPAVADEPNQAGLVIQFSEDRTETRCIPFEGGEIAGNDFLTRSGLDLVIDATSELGITVCQIEGQGCAFPAKHCFCQCMGGEGCRYWNYFYREPGDDVWTYSPLGALLREVQPGGVEAWVWGDGQTPPDEGLTFEAICRPAEPTQPPPTPSPLARAPSPVPGTRATAAASPSPSAPPASTPTGSVARGATPSATDPAAASPTSPSPGMPTGPAVYGVFGLLMLGLLLIGALVWLRRR